MATGGSENSTLCGHNETFDWLCSKCEERGATAEAISYCPSCGEYYCRFCLTYHNGFFKKHNVLGIDQKDGWGKSTCLSETGLECSEHPGQTIAMYCGIHDDVCCPACAVLEHSDNCKPKMAYLPQIAKGITQSHEFNALKSDTDGLIASYGKIEKSQQDRQGAIHKSRERCKHNIKTFSSDLSNHIKKLENDALSEIDRLHDNEDTNIKKDVQRTKEITESLQAIRVELQPKESVNESLMFVKMKSYKKTILQHTNKMEGFCSDSKKGLTFIENPDLGRMIENIKSFGSLEETDLTQASKTTESSTKVDKDSVKKSCEKFPTESKKDISYKQIDRDFLKTSYEDDSVIMSRRSRRNKKK